MVQVTKSPKIRWGSLHLGSIPTSVGNLTKLTSLALSYNSFNGMLPLSLLNLPNLSTLSLDNNQVFGPLPNHVSGLLNLNVLSLRSNFLNGTLPSWLFNLPSLVRLNLGDNQFIGEIGEFKSNSLEYLHLEYNKLHGSIPRSLLNLPNLSTLYLRNNQLVGPLPVHISSLNLVELDLSSNFLNGTLPSWLFSLPSLVELSIASNQFIEWRQHRINLLHGPQRHRVPFFAKLVGIVVVEVIVRFKIKTSTANTKEIGSQICLLSSSGHCGTGPSSTSTSSNPQQHPAATWIAPEAHGFKVNFDVATFADDDTAGLGVVI
nr:lrr receptor-like serine/threonine-protein kinase gso2 [Quercus suber]